MLSLISNIVFTFSKVNIKIFWRDIKGEKKNYEVTMRKQYLHHTELKMFLGLRGSIFTDGDICECYETNGQNGFFQIDPFMFNPYAVASG